MTAPTRVRRVREVVLPSVATGSIIAAASAVADALTERRVRARNAMTEGGIFATIIAAIVIRQQRRQDHAGYFIIRPRRHRWWRRQPPVRRYDLPPSMGTFVGVVPIAQSQTRDAQTVTLLSIDCYTEGFSLRAHHRVEEGQHRSLGSMAKEFLGSGIPSFDVRASDDLGHDYRSWPGSGSTMRHGWSFNRTFAPGIPSEARELTIAIPAPRWRYFKEGNLLKLEAPPPTDSRPLWTFTIPLTPQVMVHRSPPSEPEERL